MCNNCRTKEIGNSHVGSHHLATSPSMLISLAQLVCLSILLMLAACELFIQHETGISLYMYLPLNIRFVQSKLFGHNRPPVTLTLTHCLHTVAQTYANRTELSTLVLTLRPKKNCPRSANVPYTGSARNFCRACSLETKFPKYFFALSVLSCLCGVVMYVLFGTFRPCYFSLSCVVVPCVVSLCYCSAEYATNSL